MRLNISAASILLAAFSFSVQADDRIIYQLEDRVTQLEQKLRGSGMISIAEDVSRLQADIRELRGEIERLQYENNQAKIRQREMYLDLEKRIQQIEQQPTTVSQPEQGSQPGDTQSPDSVQAPAVNDSQGEEKDYLAAFELLKQGRYPDAISGFTQFLARYPQSDYADNAQYWLGEAYYVSRDFDKSLNSFSQLVNAHPQSSKVAGALLKIGYINYERKNYEAARAALLRITQQYPESSAASLARQRLQRMDTEGR